MANNVSTIRLADGREICFSYNVPVALRRPDGTYVKRAKHFSSTTSKHANAFAGSNAPTMTEEDFGVAIAPVALLG